MQAELMKEKQQHLSALRKVTQAEEDVQLPGYKTLELKSLWESEVAWRDNKLESLQEEATTATVLKAQLAEFQAECVGLKTMLAAETKKCEHFKALCGTLHGDLRQVQVAALDKEEQGFAIFRADPNSHMRKLMDKMMSLQQQNAKLSDMERGATLQKMELEEARRKLDSV